MKSIKCRDFGQDCDFEAQGETENEVLEKASEHGRKEHGLKEMTQELKDKVMSKIQEIKAA